MGYEAGGCNDRIANRGVLAFCGFEVYLPIFGPTDAAVLVALENAMAAMGGDEFNGIAIERCVCIQVVGRVTDADIKKYWTYDRALGGTTYGFSHLG